MMQLYCEKVILNTHDFKLVKIKWCWSYKTFFCKRRSQM